MEKAYSTAPSAESTREKMRTCPPPKLMLNAKSESPAGNQNRISITAIETVPFKRSRHAFIMS